MAPVQSSLLVVLAACAQSLALAQTTASVSKIAPVNNSTMLSAGYATNNGTRTNSTLGFHNDASLQINHDPGDGVHCDAKDLDQPFDLVGASQAILQLAEKCSDPNFSIQGATTAGLGHGYWIEYSDDRKSQAYFCNYGNTQGCLRSEVIDGLLNGVTGTLGACGRYDVKQPNNDIKAADGYISHYSNAKRTYGAGSVAANPNPC